MNKRSYCSRRTRSSIKASIVAYDSDMSVPGRVITTNLLIFVVSPASVTPGGTYTVKGRLSSFDHMSTFLNYITLFLKLVIADMTIPQRYILICIEDRQRLVI